MNLVIGTDPGGCESLRVGHSKDDLLVQIDWISKEVPKLLGKYARARRPDRKRSYYDQAMRMLAENTTFVERYKKALEHEKYAPPTLFTTVFSRPGCVRRGSSPLGDERNPSC